MPLDFRVFCNLLSALEDIERRDPPLLKLTRRKAVEETVRTWFDRHRVTIEHPASNAVALLSSLFPRSRPDRVYNIQTARLSGIIGRCLSLTDVRRRDLNRWREHGRGDLPECLERILQPVDAEPKPGVVTVDEVDAALERLASLTRFSGPDVRVPRSFAADGPVEILRPIFLKLRSREAKWMTRLILKDFGPVLLDRQLMLGSFHFLLPSLLQFQNSFHAAVALLRGPLKRFGHTTVPDKQVEFRAEATKLLEPRVGIQVGRPEFVKAWSMDHCLKLVGKHPWVLERKYDGEYCEIHIDLSRGDDCIQLFSKNGRDSTVDRQAVHPTIRRCLRIGKSDCPIKQRCILLAELVVYSDTEGRIAEYHKLRKHVSRAGVFLGVENDSALHDDECLMLVFFDILLIDGENLLASPHSQRRKRLSAVVTKVRGRAATSAYKPVDFSRPHAATKLAYQFAAAIVERYEGLVLKPADTPYFSLRMGQPDTWRGWFVKLKKDYMADMTDDRDVADLAIVGASYHPKRAHRWPHTISWTTFHVGCVVNMAHVRAGGRAVVRVVDMIHQPHCIPEHDFTALNHFGKFRAVPFEPGGPFEAFAISTDSHPCRSMEVLFREPFVVEVLGNGFEKPPNQDVFTLRHPRIVKIHWDRDWPDVVGLDELTTMADAARTIPADRDSEMSKLVHKLLKTARAQVVQKRPGGHIASSPCASDHPSADGSTASRVTPADRSATLCSNTNLILPVNMTAGSHTDPDIVHIQRKGQDSVLSERSNGNLLPGPMAPADAPKAECRPTSSGSNQENHAPLSPPTASHVRVTPPPRKRRKLEARVGDCPTEDRPGVCERRGLDCQLKDTIAYTPPHSPDVEEIVRCLNAHGIPYVRNLNMWTDEKVVPQPSRDGHCSRPESTTIVFICRARSDEARSIVDKVRGVCRRRSIILYDWLLLMDLRRYERHRNPLSPDEQAEVEQLLEHYRYGVCTWNDATDTMIFQQSRPAR